MKLPCHNVETVCINITHAPTRFEQAAAVVKELYTGKPVTARQVAERLGVEMPCARELVYRAKRYGLLEMVGSTRGAGWVPADGNGSKPTKKPKPR